MTAFFIPGSIDRKQDFLTKLGGFFKNRIDDIGCEIGATGHLVDVVIIKQLGQDEAHIAQRCFIFGHFYFLLNRS